MQLLIYGSRDFAATVTELVTQCGHNAVGMIDDFNNGEGVLGSFNEVLKSHPPSDFGIALAIGYSNIPARWEAWLKIKDAGYQAPALVHPRAYVSESARIEEGVMIMAGAIVDVRARVGEISVLWPGSCINHDCNIHENTFISPNATICGFSNVGANSFIGAGAVIVDHAQVPKGSFVKMLSRFVK